jgi:hypothetical protein
VVNEIRILIWVKVIGRHCDIFARFTMTQALLVEEKGDGKSTKKRA